MNSYIIIENLVSCSLLTCNYGTGTGNLLVLLIVLFEFGALLKMRLHFWRKFNWSLFFSCYIVNKLCNFEIHSCKNIAIRSPLSKICAAQRVNDSNIIKIPVEIGFRNAATVRNLEHIFS